jgi:hypothetical protein
MNKWTVVLSSMLACIVLVIGCSQTGGSPTGPGVDLTANHASSGIQSQTHLWGYYNVYIDLPTKTVAAELDRHAMFTANVVTFLNGKPPKLGFKINEILQNTDYVDVDIDVSLTHPFPGLDGYRGYDVRGVFIGDGSSTLAYNPALIYPVSGTDQIMLPDPDDGVGGPDGYTRWFNKPEFATGGMPLFSYTQGSVASPTFNGTATLCPYKYFADSVGVDENLWTSISANPDANGVFSAGAKNSRNYYLRFPTGKGIVYGYAVIANWTGVEEQYHPSNAPEAVACSVADNSDLWFTSSDENGGSLKLDISPWNWGSSISAGVMEDYKIIVESSVLNNTYTLNTSEMTPSAGGEHYSTYSVDIPADNITSAEGNEYWVIVEQQNADYKNNFGVTNLCGDDRLAAFFRFDLKVDAEQSPCNDLTPMVTTLNDVTNYTAFSEPNTGWTVGGSSFEDGTPAVAVNNGTSDVAFGTNVAFVDDSHITFDVDLTSVPNGIYDIVVTNGCGLQLKGTGVGLLTILRHIVVTGTPNIDVSTGFSVPWDIAVSETSDKVGITYSEVYKWRYYSNNYQNMVEYDTWDDPWNGIPLQYARNLDATGDWIHYSHELAGWDGILCWTWTDWNGTWNMSFYELATFLVSAGTYVDIANVQGHSECWGLYDCSVVGQWNPEPRACFHLETAPMSNKARYYYPAPFYNGTGDTGVVLANVKGIDMGQWVSDGVVDMYILETLPDTNTGVVELWRVGMNPPVFESSFGENFLYKPLDITVDSLWNFYVLEQKANGKYAIWAYDSTGVLVGSTGDITSDEASGTPLRIDASLSPALDEIHLLQDNGVTRFVMP